MEQGTLQAIWNKRAHRGPMDPVESVELKAGRGMVGSANQGGKRQITIMEEEVWSDLMQILGSSLDPITRRSDLMVHGIRLADSYGKTLKVGECRIRIYGETKPCERMEEALPGLEDAMYPEWRGGAFGEILDDGEIRVGDVVQWVDSEA